MSNQINHQTNQNFLTNADQLIQLTRFILAMPEMGSETTRIKMGFKEYFQSFVNKHITDPHLREKLRSIPVEIQPELDSEKNPKLTMACYHSAVIHFMLSELIKEQHDKFFADKKIEEAEAALEKLIKQSRIEKEEREALEDYIRLLAEQNHEIELMAILALSLSQKEMENKIKQLEVEQAELFEELYKAFHTGLAGHNVFDNLQDREGKNIILNEHERREIIESVVKEYTDDFVNYCVMNNAIPFNGHGQNIPNQQQAPGLNYAFENQNRDLFDQYHRENEGRFHNKFADKLRGKNVHVEHEHIAPKVRDLGDKAHKQAEKQKSKITEVATNQMELDSRKARLQEMEARLAGRRLQNALRAQ